MQEQDPDVAGAGGRAPRRGSAAASAERGAVDRDREAAEQPPAARLGAGDRRRRRGGPALGAATRIERLSSTV